MKKNEKEYESKLQSQWRPMMAWLYMATCAFDFILAPIGWAIAQALTHQTITQWNPITLQGAGLYHVAMGAVIGINSYTRSQEKIITATTTSNNKEE